MRTIRILAGGELARVHREDAVVVPDGVDRFREEVHLVVDDHSNDEGADVDVADPLLVPTVIRIFDAVEYADVLVLALALVRHRTVADRHEFQRIVDGDVRVVQMQGWVGQYP